MLAIAKIVTNNVNAFILKKVVERKNVIIEYAQIQELKYRSFCKHGSDCEFKHNEKNENKDKSHNKDEDIANLKAQMAEKDVLIKNLDKSLVDLQDELEKSKDKVDSLVQDAKNEVKTK